MWRLVHSQLSKSLYALSNYDKDMAREVILLEARVDSTKILIDSICENIITSETNPPPNIPFLIAILKMNMHLERVGDLSETIAKQILRSSSQYSELLIEGSRVIEIYRQALQMVSLGFDAFEKVDPSLAQMVLVRAEVFEELKEEVNKLLIAYSIKFPGDRANTLNIYSIIKDLERVVDQSKALAEEMIFYSEAILMIA